MMMQRPLTIGSLFSGIGGLELGLEAALEARTVWQVEQDGFCRQVLAKHWPHAVRYDDVRTVGRDVLSPVDIICGGFPCQDLSFAGKGAGLAGARSGLWREFARIVRELRPRCVVVENVPALVGRGFGTVLGDLAALGYDSWWDCVRASDIGAPHKRERLFVVAYRHGGGLREGLDDIRPGEPDADGCGAVDNPDRERREGYDITTTGRGVAAERRARVAHADGVRELQPSGPLADERGRSVHGDQGMADAHGARLEERVTCEDGDERAPAVGDGGRAFVGSAQSRMGRSVDGVPGGLDLHRWPSRPDEAQHAWEAPRTAFGVPERQRRLRALGNAVVPQVGYVIGCVVRALAVPRRHPPAPPPSQERNPRGEAGPRREEGHGPTARSTWLEIDGRQRGPRTQ